MNSKPFLLNQKVIKIIFFGFVPLLMIVALNLLSIGRLNQRLRRFSSVYLKKRQDSISDEANVTLARVGPHQPQQQPRQQQQLKAQLVELRHVYFFDKWMEKTRKRRMARKDAYSRRNKKAVSCILAITCSTLLTQSLYLISWPFYEYSEGSANHPTLEVLYVLGVWLSYLTALFNPLLLSIFNVKVKSHSKAMFQSIWGCFKVPLKLCRIF